MVDELLKFIMCNYPFYLYLTTAMLNKYTAEQIQNTVNRNIINTF